MAIIVKYGLITDGLAAACATTSTVSVTPNTGDSGFCTATSYSGASIVTLAAGNYFFIYGQVGVSVNVPVLGSTTATMFGGGCQASCPCDLVGYISTATLTLSFNGFSKAWTAQLTNTDCALGVDINFLNSVVTGFNTTDCSTPGGAANEVDSFQFSTNPFILPAGNLVATQPGGFESAPANRTQVRSQNLTVVSSGGATDRAYIDYGLGYVTVLNGETFVAGGVLVTLAVQPCTTVPSW
jgi:hypothetical protein